MRIQINGQVKTLPSSLSQMTLGQRIDFHNQYGRDLEERTKKLAAIKDEALREIEASQISIDSMFAAVSFFTGIGREVLEESEYLNTIAGLYYSSLAVLFEDQDDLTLKPEYVFQDEIWKIQEPELRNGSAMTFGEFIDSKQIVKDLMDLGSGKWEALQHLCAIYLRRPDEAYEESFIYEDSDRLKLMLDLPMDIALAVGFFLTASLNGLINTSLFSGKVPQKVEDLTVHNTMRDGDGSTS